MFQLLTIALFQFFTLNQQPDASSSAVGGSGWGNNDATTVGGSGWGNNDATTVGGSGWGNNDITK
jgi:hypothetical protein